MDFNDSDRAHSARSSMADELREAQRQRDDLVDEVARLKGQGLGAGPQGPFVGPAGICANGCAAQARYVKAAGERDSTRHRVATLEELYTRASAERDGAHREIHTLMATVETLEQTVRQREQEKSALAGALERAEVRACDHPVIVEDTGLLRTIRRAQELRITDLDGRLRAAHDSLASTDKLLAERTTARDEAHAWLRALLEQIPGGASRSTSKTGSIANAERSARFDHLHQVRRRLHQPLARAGRRHLRGGTHGKPEGHPRLHRAHGGGRPGPRRVRVRLLRGWRWRLGGQPRRARRRAGAVRVSTSTSIEWTERTWNPLTGCNKISPGCKNCYAERMSMRLKAMGQAKYQKGFALDLHPEDLRDPMRWRKPSTIFVNSMSDLFHRGVPGDFIRQVFDTMRDAHWHRFQVLTKRSERLAEIAPSLDWPTNVWMGVSVESRGWLYRIDQLRTVPAAVRFLSLEPLLEPLGELNLHGIHWVIVGGESGAGARSMELGWATAIVEQCRDESVPVFVKQLGSRPRFLDTALPVRRGKGGDMSDWPESLRVREFPEVSR